MKQKAKQFIKHPLVYGSSVVVIGGLAASFFNFLFNLFMSRSLSVSDYGVLASIISLIGFPSLVATAVMPVVVQFAGDYFAKGRLDMARGFYIKIAKFFLLVGVAFFIVYFVLLPQIGSFFHIQNSLVLFITNIIIFVTLMSVINLSFQQAKLAFAFQSITAIIGSITKLLFGVLLVIMGFSLNGAIGAMLIAVVVSYLVSFIPLKFIFDKHIGSPTFNTRSLFAYGIPSVLTLFGATSFISSDIILVKHFFTPTAAGVYAGLSLVGRVIFYLCSPVSSVMFSVLVQKRSKNERLFDTIALGIVFVLFPSIAITIFYFLFPKFSLLFFLKKEEYLMAIPYLGMFGVFITIYNVLTILINYYLSIRETKVVSSVILAALAQIILIIIYHQNFFQIISVSIVTTFLLTLLLLLYYPYAKKK